MAEHRIKFMEFVHTTGDLLNGDAKLVREFVLLGVIVRQKFVERWIEETNGGGQSF